MNSLPHLHLPPAPSAIPPYHHHHQISPLTPYPPSASSTSTSSSSGGSIPTTSTSMPMHYAAPTTAPRIQLSLFRADTAAMQRPTLANVRIRSTRDAHRIFYAVAMKQLPMTMRRLDAEERRAIVSGNVYVWEERGANAEATGLGIERWTDGMRWSPSRVRDDFLFYHQKEVENEDVTSGLQPRWAKIVKPRQNEDASDGEDAVERSPTEPTVPTHTRPSHDPQRLIKQTYSVIVTLPQDRERKITRKWHLTAYFTQASLDALQTVDEMLGPNTMAVPEGYFKSARTGKARRDNGRHRQYTFAHSYAPDSPPSASSSAGPSSSSNFVPVLPAPTSLPPATAYGEPSVPGLPIAPRQAPHVNGQSPLPQFELGATRAHGDNSPYTNVYGSSLSSPQEQHIPPPPPDRIVPSQVRSSHPPTFYTPPPPSEPAAPVAGVSPTSGHISTQLRRERYASTPPLAPHAFRAADHHHHRHTRGYSPSSSSPGTPASSTNPSSPFTTRPLAPSPPPALSLPSVANSGSPPGVPSYTYPPPPPPPGTAVGTTAAPGSVERALVPLGYLQSALFPRRDPSDDMLLRRFDAMRTPSSGSGSSASPIEDLHRIMDLDG